MTTAACDNPIGFPMELPHEIELALTVRDPETVVELWRRTEGEPRASFALSALRLGVMALRQAAGAIDSGTVRQEGERLVSAVRELLMERSNQIMERLAGSLKQYFDPTDGQLPQRLDRLVKRDGELESLLARHIGDNGSTIARTLAQHVGESSPLLKLLSPNQSDGLIAALTEVIAQALQQQRDHVLRQFSLDQKDSALSRLLQQIVDANGSFRKELSEDLTRFCGEFSLDNEDGALARLVRQVDRAQKSIVEQFSNDNENSALRKMTNLLEATNASIKASLTLDDDKSPLSRLRRELVNVLTAQNEANYNFQTEVRAALEAMKARREEADRSTRHGGEFQDAVGAVIQADAQRLGDIFTDVGDTTGRISRCKVGDHVVTLGPESAAPDVRIVCEAKAAQGYDVKAALAELQTARENREAQVGIFVFSTYAAAEGMEPLKRYGNDILVIWNQDDQTTDILLKCAMSVARAIAIREAQASAEAEANFDEIDAAVAKLGRDAVALAEVTTWANTVQSSGKKIADRVEKVREDLEKQLELLQDHLGRLKEAMQPASA
jgi:hypothetical protein